MNPSQVDTAAAVSTPAPVEQPLTPPVATPAPTQPESRVGRMRALMQEGLNLQEAAVKALTPTAPTPVVQTQPEATQEEEQPQEAVVDEDDFQLEGLESPEPPAIDNPEDAKPEKEDPDDVVGQVLATPRGKRIYAAHRMLQDLAKLPEEGGLGFRPDAEQIKQFYSAHEDFQRMQQDFTDESGRQNFANYWFGVDQQGRALPGAVEMAEQLPVLVSRTNPQAFQAMARPIAEALVNRYIELAEQSGNQEDQQMFLRIADTLSRDQLRRPILKANEQQAAIPPEFQQELDRIKREKELYEQQVRRAQQARASEFVKEIDNALASHLEADVERALQHASHAKNANPFLYQSVKDKLVSDLKSFLSRNTGGMRLVENVKQQAIRSGDRQMIGNVVQAHRKLYVDQLTSLRTNALKALNVTVTQKTQATAQKLQQTQGRTAPNAQPVPTAVSDTQHGDKPMPGESRKAFMVRQMSRVSGL